MNNDLNLNLTNLNIDLMGGQPVSHFRSLKKAIVSIVSIGLKDISLLEDPTLLEQSPNFANMAAQSQGKGGKRAKKMAPGTSSASIGGAQLQDQQLQEQQLQQIQQYLNMQQSMNQQQNQSSMQQQQQNQQNQMQQQNQQNNPMQMQMQVMKLNGTLVE